MSVRSFPLPHINSLLWAAWVFLLAVLFFLAIDAFVGRPEGDSSIYLYVGKGILEGEVPYLDRWDSKEPFFFVLNALGVLLDGIWGIWVVQAIFLLGTAYFASSVFRRGFGIVPACCALALLLVFYGWFSAIGTGNYTEQYALLFQFACLYLFLRSQEVSRETRANIRFAALHIGIGVLGAAAFLIRPNLVAIWLAIGLIWLLLKGYSLRKIAWAALGGGSVLVLVAALFAALGALGALWGAVFGYNLAHSTVTLLDRIGVVRQLFIETFPVSLIVIAAWCIGVVYLARNRTLPQPTKSLLSLALILLPLELLSLSLSGFAFPHYYLAALPAALLLVAFAVWLTLDKLPLPQSLLALLLLLGIAFYSLSDLQIDQLAKKYATEGVFAENNETRLAERISETTIPEDYILAWGKGANFYLLSDRDAPTRFFYHHPLAKPHYTTPEMRAEFFADVKANMPVFIIDSHFFWFPPLERAKRADWQPHERYMHNVDDFEPFFDFIDANYIIVEENSSFVVYALRSESAAFPTTVPGERVLSATYDVYLAERTLTYVKDRCTQDDARKRFILHVFPVDAGDTGGRAHATLDFNFLEGKTWQVSEGCLVSVALPDYPIAAIRTGQYNLARTGHDWLEEFRFHPSE